MRFFGRDPSIIWTELYRRRNNNAVSRRFIDDNRFGRVAARDTSVFKAGGKTSSVGRGENKINLASLSRQHYPEHGDS